MSRGNPSPSKDAGLRDRGRGGTNTNNATNNSADLPRIPSILATSTFSSNRDGHRMSMRTPVFDTPSASTTDSSVAPERIDMGRTVRQSSVVQLPPDNLQPATSAVTAPAAAAAAATSTFVASISGEEMPPPPPQASNTGPLSRPEGVSFTRDEDGAEDGGEVPTIPRFFFFPTFSGAHQGLGASSSTLISGVGRASGLVHVSPTASPGGGGGAAAASTAAAAGSTSGGGAGANIPNPPANWAAATAAGHGHGLAPRALGAVNVSSPTGRSPTAVKFTTGGPLHPPPYPSSLSLDGVGHVLTGGGGRGDGDGDADDEFGSVEDTSSLFGSLAVPEAASSLTGRGAAAAAHAHHPFPMADGGAADHGTGLGNTSLYGPDSSTITATNALNARHRTFSDAALKDILFFLSEVGKEAENMSLQLLIDHGEFYLLSTQSHNNVDGSPEASPTRPPAMVHQQPTNELSVSSEVLLDRPTTQRGSQRHRASSIAQPSMLPHPESSTSISESLYAPSPEFTFSMTRRATGHALNLSHESLVHHARPSRNRMSIKAASAANEEEEEGDGAEEGLAPAPAFPLFESCNAFNYSEEWFSELGRAIISPNTAHPRSGAKMALVAVTADAPLFFSGMLHDPITNRFLLGGTAFTEEARVLRVVLSSNTRQDGAAAAEGLSPMNRGGGSARARYAKLLLREYVSISKVNEGCIVQTFSVLPNDVAINPNKHATVPPKIVRVLVNQTEAGALTRAFSLHGVCRRRPVQEKTPAEVVVTLPRALSNPPAVAGRRIDSLTRPGDAPLAGPLERNSLMSVESSFASGGTLVEELTSPFTHVVVTASGSGTTITNGGGSRRISLRRAPSPLDRVVSPNARALYGATPITQGSSSTASVPFTGVLAMRRRTREALGTELYLREENPTLFQWVVERDPAHFVEPIDNIRTYLTHYKQVTSVRMAVKALFFSARRIQRFLRYCIAKKRRALMRMLRLWRQLEIEAKLKLQHYTPAPSSIERIDMIAGTVLQEHMITTKDYKIAVIQEMWEIRRSSYRKWRRERQVDALLRRQDWKSAAVELPSTLQSDDDWSHTSRPSICTTRSNETAVPHLDCLVLDAAREAVKDQEKPVAVTTSPELRAAARQLRQGLERHSLFGWYMEPETLLYESHRRLLLTLKSSVLTMEQVQYEVQRESAEAARQRAKASSPTSRMTPRKPEGAMMGGGLQSVAGYTRGTSMSVGSRRSVMRRADAGK